MATYLQRDVDGNPIATPFGKPAPAHALTVAAEAARDSVRDAAAARQGRITRADVEAAYVHPAPEAEAFDLPIAGIEASSAYNLAQLASDNGHRVKAIYNRGTTLPKWHVNSPDNKTNPGPLVDASQYHGDVVDCETVYVVTSPPTGDLRVRRDSHRIRGVWLNGKLDRIEVDGVETTLRAAREVLS